MQRFPHLLSSLMKIITILTIILVSLVTSIAIVWGSIRLDHRERDAPIMTNRYNHVIESAYYSKILLYKVCREFDNARKAYVQVVLFHKINSDVKKRINLDLQWANYYYAMKPDPDTANLHKDIYIKAREVMEASKRYESQISLIKIEKLRTMPLLHGANATISDEGFIRIDTEMDSEIDRIRNSAYQIVERSLE